MAGHDTLIDALQAEVGDGLRSVATYDRDGYELLYVREDVEMAYADQEIQAIYEDVLLQTMTREHFEGLFNAGRYECSALGFEDAVVFQFVEAEFEGLYVSFDRGAGVEVSSFIQVCKQHT